MAGGVGDGEFGFQIAPMLDILFVLLLFFMVSAGAQKTRGVPHHPIAGRQAGRRRAVPGGDRRRRPGQCFRRAVRFAHRSGFAATRGEAQGVVAANAVQPVVVTPARSTRQQRVVDVLNACAAAKVKNLAFGAPAD